MRWLAEFIMRGRAPAVCIALLGSWVPLLSQATVGFVSLRKGWLEGLLIAIAASLPSLMGLYFEHISLTVIYSTAAVFWVTWVSGLVLRTTMSWSMALAVLVVLSALVATATGAVNAGFEDDIAKFFEEAFSQSQPQNREAAVAIEAMITGFTALKSSGVISTWVGVSALGGLIMGRWLQALLFNPGGFREEFHGLRLELPVALLAIAGVIFCGAGGSEYLFWGYLVSLPLIIAGLGLVHHLIAAYKLGVTAIIIMYVALVLFNPFLLVLLFLAIVDAWVDLRQRFKFKQ